MVNNKENDNKNINVNIIDKYAGKPLKFFDKQTHYEMFFIDDFNFPDKDYTVLSDILVDLKNADKSKELHIWINSCGGYVINLISLLQVVLEFKHVVTICNGYAMSCGFYLWCCGKERYVSKFSALLYHALSTGIYGKGLEIKSKGDFTINHNNILLKTTGANNFLTKEEVILGETTEVWFLGDEFINRGVAQDYSLYRNRNIPTNINVLKIVDDIYMEENNEYIKFEKSKDKPLLYEDILNLLKNKDLK